MSANDTSMYRLSLQQRRLWALQQDGSVFPCFCMIRMDGMIDLMRMEQALRRLVEVHSALRTTFPGVRGLRVPCQSVSDSASIGWQIIDWSSAEPEDQQGKLDRLIDEQTARKPDLKSGPMVHGTLVCLDQAVHALLLSLPGLCADSASLANLTRQLRELYAGEGAPGLTDLIQYTQVSEWNHGALAEKDAAAGMNYWRTKTLTSVPAASLPFETPASKAMPFRAQSFALKLSPDIPASMEAREFFFTCWQILLSRLTGQRELLIGRVHDGRDYDEFAPACGLFARVLPHRAHFSQHLRFRELLLRNQEARNEADEWQTYFQWDEGTGESAFFPFVEESEVWAFPESAAGAKFSIWEQGSEIDRYKLKLRSSLVGPDQWRVSLHFDPGFIDLSTARRFGRYLGTLMTAAIQAPESLVDELPILNQADRAEVLAGYQPRSLLETFPDTIHGMFEQEVRRNPHAIAVRSAREALTYDELNRRANQFARFLRKAGVAAESRVVLIAERTVATIVAIMGILKAGGAYVPVDAAYPKERIEFVLQDAGAALIVTQESLASLLPQHTARVIRVDAEWEQISAEADANLPATVVAENLAYVIYTSGSTGNPKGALISHRNLVSSTRARESIYLDPIKCFLLLSSFAFDSSVAGIFWTLCSGGVLHLPQEKVQMDVNGIADTVDKYQVSHLLCLPSLYLFALKAADTAKLASLRVVIVAGEACSRDLVALHSGKTSAIRLFNEYGPTEATVWSTVHEVRKEDQDGPVPIGRAVSQAYVYLLDANMNLVPPGVEGELYIGGEGLSRGYLGRAALTAERFMPDPYRTYSGARVYKTGDLGTYALDGSIRFLGRADHQVKIRGYRVELGEIEAAIRDVPSVEDAVVIMNEDDGGDTRLVAYLVSKDSASLRPAQAYKLPNGMWIAHQNKNETDYLYQEIFESNTYLRHGIFLPKHACVFDVGANIGMFALFVSQQCPSCTVYAFEPIPQLYAILRQNADLVPGRKIKAFQCGLSNQANTQDFTYYARSTMMSTQTVYANTDDEMSVVKRFLRNQEQAGVQGAGHLLGEADEILSSRFAAQIYPCALRRLSDVIRDEHIERIDLLKIDVQRAELDVLRGIDPADWGKIDQIVIEAHDTVRKETGRVQQIVELLDAQGFRTEREQEQRLMGTDLHNVYGARHGQRRATDQQDPERSAAVPAQGESALVPALRSILRSKLPEYMVPTQFELVARLPLLPNGKIDRKALPKPGQSRGNTAYSAPGTVTEMHLAALWSEMLRVDNVGLDDNFFDLGGHSFLAIKLHHRLSQSLRREIPLPKLFEHPTVRTLARFLDASESAAQPDQNDRVQQWAQDRRAALLRQRELARQSS